MTLGRYVYGAAVIAAGMCVLGWHDFANWQQPGHAAYRPLLAYAIGAIEVVGGASVGVTLDLDALFERAGVPTGE
jgi:hypothetical protein